MPQSPELKKRLNIKLMFWPCFSTGEIYQKYHGRVYRVPRHPTAPKIQAVAMPLWSLFTSKD